MTFTSREQMLKEIQDANRNHWKFSEKRGTLKDIYHYPLTCPDNSEIIAKLKEILKDFSDKKIKINLSFGFIMRHKITEELTFFDCSTNTPLFQRPKTLYSHIDNEKVMKDIEEQNVFDYAFQQRPSPQWLVETIVCIQFTTYRPETLKCGRCLKYIPTIRGTTHRHNNKRHRRGHGYVIKCSICKKWVPVGVNLLLSDHMKTHNNCE